MKIFFSLIFTYFLFIPIMSGASQLLEAKKIATNFLSVENIYLESQSKRSYFFVTGFEYDVDDVQKEHPCFRGVLVDKKSNSLSKPLSDAEIKIYYRYSDTSIDGFIVKNCAD